MSNQVGFPGLGLHTLGFSIEMYTYMMLCNTMVMPAAYQESTVDTFVMSFEEMSQFPKFGSFFAGAHELYQLVPEIADLGSRRFAEEANGLLQPSPSVQHMYESLFDRVSTWTMQPRTRADDKDWELRQCAAEVWRHALQIYLTASISGSIVSDSVKKATMAFHTIEAFTLVGGLVSSQQNYFATMLWPVLVSGSCITQVEGQENMSRVFKTAWSGMRHMTLWIEVLQLMWDDPDPRAYGPYGLMFTMQKHNKVLGIL
jgi:hypothetical protein